MQTSDQGYDSILCNGQVVDGSGNPWFRADVGIKSGQIAAVGDLSAAEGRQRIDVAGRVVCPGFIDIHNHSDLSLLARPEADSHVRQGVTTMVIGNCGESAAPLTAGAGGPAGFLDEEGLLRAITTQGRRWTSFGEYLEVVESRRCATNVAALVGHGNVRNVVLGWEKRAPDAAELERMEGLVAEAMEAGAFGLSFGLLYPPGFFAQRDELVALNRVVGRYGGFHSIHMRDERDPERYRASVLEGIEIGEHAGIPAHISHIEAHYPNWGMQAEMLGLLESARARGMDVTCDVPPYLLSSSTLSITMPDWAMDGGFDSLLKRLRDPALRNQIREWVLAQKPFGARFILDGHWDKAWLGALWLGG
jgi:N-acyl-D-amino-acid deacylase